MIKCEEVVYQYPRVNIVIRFCIVDVRFHVYDIRYTNIQYQIRQIMCGFNEVEKWGKRESETFLNAKLLVGVWLDELGGKLKRK